MLGLRGNQQKGLCSGSVGRSLGSPQRRAWRSWSPGGSWEEVILRTGVHELPGI